MLHFWSECRQRQPQLLLKRRLSAFIWHLLRFKWKLTHVKIITNFDATFFLVNTNKGNPSCQKRDCQLPFDTYCVKLKLTDGKIVTNWSATFFTWMQIKATLVIVKKDADRYQYSNKIWCYIFGESVNKGNPSFY